MDSAAAGDTLVPDHDVCAAGMQECAPGNGAYPVSFNLGWHGGVHLIAPRNAQGNAERVRAIADGTVVYVRKTAAAGVAALSYRGVRTDDGCVVIKHTTEIGEGDTAKVTFFSIYMHLQTVQALVVGKKIYRKDELGVAGSIYGQRGQIHFEIVCDDANLKNLVGRTSGPLSAGSGRKDAIYGDIWFKVPKGTLIFQNEPHPNRLDDRGPPPCAYAGIQPQAGTPTAVEYVVRMRYERGNCMLTTFKQQADGNYADVGESPVNQGYEYGLYEQANCLHAKYFELNHAAGCAYAVVPSPSAIYEMLRFGRIVGPDAMPPYAKFGHWRKVTTPEATGWMNLHSPEIGVYSDADFPHWAGWSLIDDSTTSDSRCNSPTIMRWLDLNGDGHITHAEAVGALPSVSTQKRLSKAICKFPAEWSRDGETIKSHWGWLMQASELLLAPLTGTEFIDLTEHIQALAFWEDVHDPQFPNAERCWHLPPKGFIEHSRKCEWLGIDELTQLIPRRFTLNNVVGSLDWNEARRRLNGGTIQYSDLCKTFRKYRFSTAERQIAFLCQCYIETGMLRTSVEDGLGIGASGNTAYYTVFYGRGLMQLTWPTLYENYGRYRCFANNAQGHYVDSRITPTSRHHWSGPPVTDAHGHVHADMRQWAPRFDPSLVSLSSFNVCDSAGFFWFWKHFMGTSNILRLADEGITTKTVGRMSVLVNGGGNGYAERQQYAAFLMRYRGDSTETNISTTLSFFRQRIVPHPHQAPTWGQDADQLQVTVNFTPQRRSE